VLESDCIDPSIRAKAIRVDDAFEFDHFLNETVQVHPGTSRNGCHANSTDARTIFFCGDHDYGFLLNPRTILWVFTANVRLIHLHDAGQLLTSRTNHRTT
jgi:hypothetical protein